MRPSNDSFAEYFGIQDKSQNHNKHHKASSTSQQRHSPLDSLNLSPKSENQ